MIEKSEEVLVAAARLLGGRDAALSRNCSAWDGSRKPCDPWEGFACAWDVHGAIDRVTDPKQHALRQEARGRLIAYIGLEDDGREDVLARWSDSRRKPDVIAALLGAAKAVR